MTAAAGSASCSNVLAAHGEWSNGKTQVFGALRFRFESGLPSWPAATAHAAPVVRVG